MGWKEASGKMVFLRSVPLRAGIVCGVQYAVSVDQCLLHSQKN